jgi:hypothetical protein
LSIWVSSNIEYSFLTRPARAKQWHYKYLPKIQFRESNNVFYGFLLPEHRLNQPQPGEDIVDVTCVIPVVEKFV